MTFTLTVGLATLLASVAAFLQMLQPETWTPFYRAELAKKATRARALAGLFIGLVGQAATTAIVGLLVTILVLSVVTAADEDMRLWAGAAIALLSPVFFVRHWRMPEKQWADAEALLGVLGHRQSGSGDPYGKLERTPGELVRTAIFSPRFILAPMFLAASASGHPGVGNAVPVVLAYAVFSMAGLVWLVAAVAGGRAEVPCRAVVARTNLIVGAAVIALGLVTAFAG